MDELGLGAGLAALAFWGFVAAVAVASIWDGVRKREAQQETVRRLVESGQHIDERVVDKLLQLNEGGKRLDREFKLTALYLLPVAAGLFVFGLILGSQYPEAWSPIVGASALVACLGVGFLLAARIVARWNGEQQPDLEQPKD